MTNGDDKWQSVFSLDSDDSLAELIRAPFEAKLTQSP